MTMWEDW